MDRLTVYIRNPLIISIAIGKYDKVPTDSEIRGDGMFPNLIGIENDIKNIYKLFRRSLRYKIFPKYNIKTEIKTCWTKQEIIDLLKKSGKYLDENVKNGKHDGLVVVVSSHGIQDHIVTSDYKKINKDTIHRIFSVDFPSLRHIPGIFIYDCCDGDNQRVRHTTRFSHDLQKHMSKGTSVGNVGHHVKSHSVMEAYGANKEIWYKNEPNPDYKLVVINSSNKGFMSQMGNKSGSYMINKFTQKMTENINGRGNKSFLFQIFHEIQDELHDTLGKQLIEAKYNNKLEYVKFLKNGVDRAGDGDYVELAELASLDSTIDSTYNNLMESSSPYYTPRDTIPENTEIDNIHNDDQDKDEEEEEEEESDNNPQTNIVYRITDYDDDYHGKEQAEEEETEIETPRMDQINSTKRRVSSNTDTTCYNYVGIHNKNITMSVSYDIGKDGIDNLMNIIDEIDDDNNHDEDSIKL